MKFSVKFATLRWWTSPTTLPPTSARSLWSRTVEMMFQRRKFAEQNISLNAGPNKSHTRSVKECFNVPLVLVWNLEKVSINICGGTQKYLHHWKLQQFPLKILIHQGFH